MREKEDERSCGGHTGVRYEELARGGARNCWEIRVRKRSLEAGTDTGLRKNEETLLSSLWVSRTGSVSDWCALQEALYKCIDTIQYERLGCVRGLKTL